MFVAQVLLRFADSAQRTNHQDKLHRNVCRGPDLAQHSKWHVISQPVRSDTVVNTYIIEQGMC